MSDLSWNPLTWTPSNLAEGLSDAIGLPEVVGDLVGGGVSLLTGDFAGAIDQGIDFAENVFAAVSWDNDKFLHGPGGIPSPDCKCCPPNTYPPGEPSGPTDMGPFQRLGKEIDEAFGLSPTKKPGTTSQTGQAGGVGELEITGKESVEELILKILLHLKKSAKARMQETALELKALSDQQNQIGQQMKGLTVDRNEGELRGLQQDMDRLGRDKDDLNFKLQQATNDFNDLNKLLTNIADLFHQARGAAIDKIGR